MRAAHWLVIVFIVSVGALGAYLVATATPEGREDPARPDRGRLAPLLEEVPHRPLARLPGGAGQVVELAVSPDALAVLAGKSWFLQVGDSLWGPFGDPVAGSPDWLSRPVSIALGKDRVYVLDAGRFAVSVWGRDGARQGDILLKTGEESSYQPAQVLLGPGGEVLVVSFSVDREGTGRWEVLAYPDGDPPRTLLSLEDSSPSFLFDRPHLAVQGGSLVGVRTLAHAFFHLRPGSLEWEPLLERADPPLWYVPRRHQRRYGALLGQMGGALASLSRLPPFWPSVRDFSLAPDGAILLAVSAGEDRQHLELLAPDGLPLRRFNPDGFLDPVFLDGGRAFLVREDLNETVIHEFVIERR